MKIGALRATAGALTLTALLTTSLTTACTTDRSVDSGPASPGSAVPGHAGTASPASEVPASVTTTSGLSAGTATASRVAGSPASVVRVVRVSARARPVDCRRAKCVALTFDDGPGAYTDALLRHLAAYRAKATFFVVGQNVAANPGIVRRTYAAGHEIGSHTWSHPDLTKLPAAGVRAQLARTDRVVKAAIGVVPRLVRPPYGAVNAAVSRLTGRPMVLWSVDTLDWRHRDSAKVARKAVRSVRPGSVILFHDIHPSTVRAMPRILKALSKRGYRFVTVTRLFGGHPPNTVYSAGLT
ncbi:polysaccharide deacetylase family protein [Nonomuraea sp. NPDC049419]|uniref:polysaccharide deacetylase family protein n=1 Tax=Nonomuraea sp. NPDC049419 TaxID=3155772 RepID=UPI0034484A61